MKLNTDKIYKIALNVRNWAEQVWLNEQQQPDMCGCCVIASAKLMKELQAEGFDAQVRISEYHGYVVVGKFIVDVTATQFDIEDIVVLETERQFMNKWGYKNHIMDAYSCKDRKFNTFTNIEDAMEHQREYNWPKEQCISTYLGVM